MKKRLILLVALICSFAVLFTNAEAATQKKHYENWNQIVKDMDSVLNQSYDEYAQGKLNEAKALVNQAYYGFYEKYGVERTVGSHISGSRVTETEYKFKHIKTLMIQKQSNEVVRAEIDSMLQILHNDANELDGTKDNLISSFLASLVIIVREGTEAILVIAAISAYLVRSGNFKMMKIVYASSLAAIIASILMAFVINYALDISGANQEIVEGATMLVAMVVLFFVSNWMFSKAESNAWKHYVEDKVKTAVETGSGLALAGAAFLSVFREGAETILFYQAMISDPKEQLNMVWLGLGVGCLLLVVIFAVIRYGSMKLPLKPFFIGTSFLMYLMAVSFAGGGVKELQEGDIFTATPINGFPTIEILGIYPTVETLIPQIIMLVIVIASIFYYKKKSRS